MKGRDRFNTAEAERIRELLYQVRLAEPGGPQKRLRDKLRATGFYISDWEPRPVGFAPSDFDGLIARGLIVIGDDHASRGEVVGSQPPKPATPAPRPGDSTPDSDVEELVAAALNALSEPRLQIDAALAGAVPNRPGLYAIYADTTVWRRLGFGEASDDRPLYVGKAEKSLVSRDLKTHFPTGKTGRSSPRRSFAALLADDLGLVAIPRRPANPEPTKWTHYALESTADRELTDWMLGNLQLAVWESPPAAPLIKVELAVMRAWLPPLNLIGIKTPWTAEIKAARGALAEGAKQSARDRGLAVD